MYLCLFLSSNYSIFSNGSELDQIWIRIVCHITSIYQSYICHIYAIYLIRYMAYKWGINAYEIRINSDPILIQYRSKSIHKRRTGYFTFQQCRTDPDFMNFQDSAIFTN